jgi:hypothetical protein
MESFFEQVTINQRHAECRNEQQDINQHLNRFRFQRAGCSFKKRDINSWAASSHALRAWSPP